MTWPLVLLSICAVLLSFVATPAWPWLQSFLEWKHATLDFRQLTENGLLQLMLASSLVVFAGLGLGWWLYGRKPSATDQDALEQLQPAIFRALRNGLYLDAFYAKTIQQFVWWIAIAARWLDDQVWIAIPGGVATLLRSAGLIDTALDRRILNQGFEETCHTVSNTARLLARLQDGNVQHYLRWIGAAVAALAFFLLLGHMG